MDAFWAGDDGAVIDDTGRGRPDSRLELPHAQADADFERPDSDFTSADSAFSLPDAPFRFDATLSDAAFGDVTLAIDAPLDCAPMDAMPTGPCALVLGVVWNGTACVSISGCDCVGTDCADVFRTEAACRARYARCRG